jgi:hypothetical protein
MIPALRRLPDVRRVIDQKGYFVVHAPRQVGKTTSLLALGRELTDSGRYVAALVSMIVGPRQAGDVDAIERAVLTTWREAARAQLPPELLPPPWPDADPGSRLAAALAAWARSAPRPLVLFLDEIDALRGDLLVSALRQVQEGYRNRPVGFPWSIAFVGLRDLRDYRIDQGDAGQLGTPSPFNIIVRSLAIRNFTEEEVAELYLQHTGETGQRFEPEAVALSFALSRGQPWIVNALAKIAVEELVTDPAEPVTAAAVERARAILIARRDVHLDSLAARLREPRVRAIIEPMLAGELMGEVPEDDRRFALDLGLVRETEQGGLDVANPIYREVIARSLSSGARDSLPQIAPTWLRSDGRLDAERLLEAFLSFWRRHGEPLLRTAHYHEVAPHLVLMAFLDRVANGGGTVDREFALGRGGEDPRTKGGAAKGRKGKR